MSTLVANSSTSQLIIYQSDDAGADLSQLAHPLSDKTRKND
jgi:hypothetical protein